MTRSLMFRLSLCSVLILASCHKKETTPLHQETVLYETGFDSDDDHWFVGESQYGTGSIENGFYKIVNKSASSTYFSYTDPFFNNHSEDKAIETALSVSKAGDNEQAFGGLIWALNANNTTEKKVFGCYNNGYYEVFSYDAGGQYVVIRSSTFSEAVHKGDSNILRIELRSGTLHFLINGTEVYSMASGDNLDDSGFFMDGGCVVLADYFKAVLL